MKTINKKTKNNKQLSKFAGIFALAAILITGFSITPNSFAYIDSTTADVTLVTGGAIPSDVTPGANEDNTQALAFEEKQLVELDADLAVDHDGTTGGPYLGTDVANTGIIPAGTIVNSHFIHWDPEDATGTTITGSATFVGKIIGVQINTASIVDTNGNLGLGSVTYATNQIGAADEFTISVDGKTIDIDFYATSGADNIRVITEPDVLEVECSDNDEICKYVSIVHDDLDSNGYIEPHEPVSYYTKIVAQNPNVDDWEDVKVQDNLGGDLTIGGADEPEDDLTNVENLDCVDSKAKGKTKKVQIRCEVEVDGILSQDEKAIVEFLAETDVNPGQGKDGGQGKLEYTSCGIHYANSGATVSGFDTDSLTSIEYSTEGIFVEVFTDDKAGDCDDDAVIDADDNCPFTPNNDQTNIDGDEFGDVCDADIDGDGLSNDDETNIYNSDPYVFNNVIIESALDGSPGSGNIPFADLNHESTSISYGDGSCAAYDGGVFVLDNGYVNVYASGLLRTGFCDIPPTHDNVHATLHCTEGDIGPTGSVPLSFVAGATADGTIDLTDTFGSIGTCTDATLFVESDTNNKWLARSP